MFYIIVLFVSFCFVLFLLFSLVLRRSSVELELTFLLRIVLGLFSWFVTVSVVFVVSLLVGVHTIVRCLQ